MKWDEIAALGLAATALGFVVVTLGKALTGPNFAPKTAQPTQLILTVVEEERPPSVCVFDVATETLIGDTIRVVVNRAPCPALQP